eukprot:CAMPEP_0197297244 /NCGR_PEP_ID=MMETSP0890-20130614/40540_1 /TAXON_ID=44058 ORGANISM="Aureoumbra lagunensis, Strain CCMP1510" /NCGR_SAMPLE_ID=MMETSP0890 /ASSEMBLY_ACC=CAM_ASM_000533 /LENGTH=66 /DNA_ID=CAMNT_0042774287 /DNA_START=1696 /DNA_END=1896 /DNA_ORIENTATION=+
MVLIRPQVSTGDVDARFPSLVNDDDDEGLTELLALTETDKELNSIEKDEAKLDNSTTISDRFPSLG